VPRIRKELGAKGETLHKRGTNKIDRPDQLTGVVLRGEELNSAEE
jgi:hypothetical protein